MKQPMRSKAGFTLVEVLLTLLIMSMMMTAIVQLLNGARRTRDLVHNTQESQLAGPAILDLIARDLMGIVVNDREKISLLRVLDNAKFGIDADRIDFVTSTDSVLITPNDAGTRYLRADTNEVGYMLKSNEDFEGEFLEIWRREDFGVDDEPLEGGRFTFLHDRVRGFDILVFNENGIDAEPLESWGIETADEEFRGLPVRLEIRLELELAPRMINEQSTFIAAEKRRVVYRRMIQIPQRLHHSREVLPVLTIPEILPITPDAGGGAASGPGGPGTPGGPTQLPPGTTMDASGNFNIPGGGAAGGGGFGGFGGGGEGGGTSIFDGVVGDG